MKRGEVFYHGKAKTLYRSRHPDLLIVEFRDDATAFEGRRTAQLAHKGEVNNRINALIMEVLAEAGVATHFAGLLEGSSCLVRQLTMLPIECVIRNRAAGSICRRLGVEKNRLLTPPVLEMFLKNDTLGDPLINHHHIQTFDWATPEQVEQMVRWCHLANDQLTPLFDRAGIELVDFKLEFGIAQGRLWLGDEFTPDSCRLRDSDTGAALDKDLFRQNQPGVVAAYEQVAERLAWVIAHPE